MNTFYLYEDSSGVENYGKDRTLEYPDTELRECQSWFSSKGWEGEGFYR